jgi:hypothetical protein
MEDNGKERRRKKKLKDVVEARDKAGGQDQKVLKPGSTKLKKHKRRVKKNLRISTDKY